MSSIEVDFAIVGSGCAGAAAACAAAELGLRVAVFEKAPVAGGPIRGANGPFAVGSAMQKERQVSFGPGQALRRLMEHTHGRTDMQLAAAYFNKSADTIEWLQAKGVVFNDVVSYYAGAEYTWHHKDPASPDITEALLTRAVALGAQVHTATPAEVLTRSAGRVTGLVARQEDGQVLTVKAGAVLVATGGFGGNPDWIKQHTGWDHGRNLFSFAFPDCQGDGLRMAWEAGAGASPMVMQTYVCLPAPFWGPGGTPPHLGLFRQPGLLVNRHGERFVNEEVMANPAFAANAVARQPGGWAVMIFDAGTTAFYEHNDWDFLMSKLPVKRSHDTAGAIAKATAEGYGHLFSADSLEALAAQAGIDPAGLAATVEAYNEGGRRAQDPLFHKSAQHLKPVMRGPFHAARFYVGGYGSLGGIRINHRTEVLCEAGKVIEGLYAAGRDANALYGDTYPYAMAGNDTGFDFNTGRIAAEQVAMRLGGRREAS